MFSSPHVRVELKLMPIIHPRLGHCVRVLNDESALGLSTIAHIAFVIAVGHNNLLFLMLKS